MLTQDNNKKLLAGVLILGFLIVMVVYVYRHNKKKEGYKKCVCSSDMNKTACQDIEQVQDDYNNNTVTEFSTLKPNTWSNASPGDMDFPENKGCPWSAEPVNNWVAWDYEDLVG
jgi:hypothetical protein